MHDSVNDSLQSFQRIFLEACSESDIDPKNISIVAVSKKKDVSLIRAVYENGFRDFGENFAQELSEKSNQLMLPKNCSKISSIRLNFFLTEWF